MKKIAVIGAGLGGLSAAIRLANAGFNVDVYEQNSSAGGKANVLCESGFRFDTGPSLLTMPFVLQQLFEESGENFSEYLSLTKLEIICKYFYPDGTIINAYSGNEKFSKEIEEKTGDNSDDVIKYLRYCRKIYDLTADLFLFKDPSELKSYLNLNALSTLLQINKIDPFRTMHDANSDFFKDKKTIQLFDRYATYNGSNPYSAPAILNIIQHVEYNLGAFVTDGGIYPIVNALVKLAEKKGVKFFYNSRIEELIKSGNSVDGIKVNGKKIKYDYLISNADVNFTYKYLLNEAGSKYVKNYEENPSLSGLVFYWGIEGIHKDLEVHNIIFSEDYKKEFEDIFSKKIIPGDPTVYIYISSNYNSKDAPEGNENWFVMINAPFNDGQNWEAEISNARKKIIEKINRVLDLDISKKIKFEKLLSPVILETATNSYKGSIYGLSSNSRRAAFMRHPNHSKKYRNLFFCGGSVHPGGGIPLVILSGKNAANNIIKKFSDD